MLPQHSQASAAWPHQHVPASLAPHQTAARHAASQSHHTQQWTACGRCRRRQLRCHQRANQRQRCSRRGWPAHGALLPAARHCPLPQGRGTWCAHAGSLHRKAALPRHQLSRCAAWRQWPAAGAAAGRARRLAAGGGAAAGGLPHPLRRSLVGCWAVMGRQWEGQRADTARSDAGESAA